MFWLIICRAQAVNRAYRVFQVISVFCSLVFCNSVVHRAVKSLHAQNKKSGGNEGMQRRFKRALTKIRKVLVFTRTAFSRKFSSCAFIAYSVFVGPLFCIFVSRWLWGEWSLASGEQKYVALDISPISEWALFGGVGIHGFRVQNPDIV